MKNKIIITILCLVLILTGLFMFNTKEPVNEVLSFPYYIEEIELSSLFQSSIDNPDCNNEIGEDIASLEIMNHSKDYISKITITLKTIDKELNFEAYNIPADKKVWALDINNTSIEELETITDISYDIEYLKEDQLMSEEISVISNMSEAEIKNLTDKTLNNLTLKFHCLYDDTYLGGTVYTYTIDSLLPGETKILNVEECYLGLAEAVQIIKE